MSISKIRNIYRGHLYNTQYITYLLFLPTLMCQFSMTSHRNETVSEQIHFFILKDCGDNMLIAALMQLIFNK